MKHRKRWIGFLLVIATMLSGCGAPPAGEAIIRLSSPAFGEGTSIPVQYTCDGQDASPLLEWNGAPQGTRSLALIMDDPDAPGGTFTHWLVYALAPGMTHLSEGVPPSGREGANSFGRTGYGGPCPPSGQTHRYVFKLYALDREIDLPIGASKSELETVMQGHVIGQGRLTGTYRRP
jgi:Raf kinase inhibitor-like YbhB/YbcL family protein